MSVATTVAPPPSTPVERRVGRVGIDARTLGLRISEPGVDGEGILRSGPGRHFSHHHLSVTDKLEGPGRRRAASRCAPPTPTPSGA